MPPGETSRVKRENKSNYKRSINNDFVKHLAMKISDKTFEDITTFRRYQNVIIE